MADAEGAESRPMTRGKEFRLPLAALNNKERGLRAAIQVLQDGLSPKQGPSGWLMLTASGTTRTSLRSEVRAAAAAGVQLQRQWRRDLRERRLEWSGAVLHVEQQALSVERLSACLRLCWAVGQGGQELHGGGASRGRQVWRQHLPHDGGTSSEEAR